MNLLKNLKTTAFISLMMLTTTSAAGQDLLARQAPVDRQMKAVDSIALNRLIEQEMFENPAGDLYDEWDNELTHYQGMAIPDETTIDLRGFCMPTESRVVTSNFGARWGRQHKGLDIKVYIGDTIRAAFSGKVRIRFTPSLRDTYLRYCPEPRPDVRLPQSGCDRRLLHFPS